MTNRSPSEGPQFPLFEDGELSPASASRNFSDFVVYVDESGDHGMATIDANYPVFVLSFCVFHKRYYSEKIVPALEKFKFNHFGHDLVVLHEHEIRKETGAFNCFRNRDEQRQFIATSRWDSVSKRFISSCERNSSARQLRMYSLSVVARKRTPTWSSSFDGFAVAPTVCKVHSLLK